MGHRANYALIEGGRLRLYFSRWGALTTPAVVLSGPEDTIAYVRNLTPTDGLLNNTWAEGVIFINIDTRTMKFSGGDDIDLKPYLRRPLLRAVRSLWPGWSVEWARFGVVDLAIGIGWDLKGVIDDGADDPEVLDSSDPLVDEPDVVAISSAGELKGNVYELITIHFASGEVSDYGIGLQDRSVLLVGPRLIDRLRTLSAITLIPGSADSWEAQGAYIDERTNTLWINNGYSGHPGYIDAVARRWPGWTTHSHTEGLARQIELSGRDPSPYMTPDDQAIEELIGELVSESSVDPMSLYRALTQDGKQVTVGEGFFKSDSPPLSPNDRRELLRRVFQTSSVDDSTDLQR